MGKLTSSPAEYALDRPFLRIAMLHLAPRYDNVQHNRELLEAVFLKAVDLQADLIITPELAVSGYGFYKILGRDWIADDSHKIVARFSQLAAENNVALVLGSPIFDKKSDRFYNAAIFIDERGQVLGQHHKFNVLPGSEAWSSPGVEIKPVNWHRYKIGLLICADAYTDKITSELASQGAHVLISPAAWCPGLHGPDGEWEQRSKETGLCLFVSNRTGNDAQLNFDGSSSLIAVAGSRMLEYSDKKPAILTVDVNADTWLPINERFNVVQV